MLSAEKLFIYLFVGILAEINTYSDTDAKGKKKKGLKNKQSLTKNQSAQSFLLPYIIINLFCAGEIVLLKNIYMMQVMSSHCFDGIISFLFRFHRPFLILVAFLTRKPWLRFVDLLLAVHIYLDVHLGTYLTHNV